MQLREFLREAAQVLREPLLADWPAENWQAAFRVVVERWKGPGPLVLVLDEFQWTVGASPELPSMLQELWDREWQKSGKVLLILCGSFIGFMEREVLGRESPLFGRRTAQIHLQPFSYLEAAGFHPRYSVVDRARTFFLCGGIPLYLKCFSDQKSVEQNIAATLLGEYSPLYREPAFLLREELRDVELYSAVLLAVAAGATANKEISKQAGVGEGNLFYYLQTLVDLGYLKRRYPLTGGLPIARQVRYAIGDPLLRFWFRFVFPNLSHIARVGPEMAMQQCVAPEFDSFCGLCFEGLCREALAFQYVSQRVATGYEVGEYWDKNCQIDVIGYRKDGWTDLGECKWGNIRSSQEVIAELQQRVEQYPNARNATIGRHIFMRSKPTQAQRRMAPEIEWHGLDDLYQLTDPVTIPEARAKTRAKRSVRKPQRTRSRSS